MCGAGRPGLELCTGLLLRAGGWQGMGLTTLRAVLVVAVFHMAVGENKRHWGYAGFSLPFHLPGFHLGVPIFDPQRVKT